MHGGPMGVMTSKTFASLLFAFALMSAFRLTAHDLVELRTIDPRILVDMRYATARNPLGHQIYPFGGCFVVKEVAYKLSRVQRDLEKEGLGLKVWDAYRPYSMQPLLWKEVEVTGMPCATVEKILAEDESGHNRGTAVDVTVVCYNGSDLEMPTDFEDFSDKAHPGCCHLDCHVYHNKFMLEKIMKRHGFVQSPTEWWHFDFRAWQCYPILDVKFEDLVNCHMPVSTCSSN